MEKQDILNLGTDTLKKKRTRFFDDKKAAMISVIRATCACALGFLFTSRSMLFDCYPLAFSYLSASTAYAPFALFGVIVASCGGTSINISVAVGGVITLLSRIISSFFLEKSENATHNKAERKTTLGKLFSESVYLRILSSAIGVFATGVWRIIEGGFRFYDLFAAFFYLIVTPIAALIFCGYFRFHEMREREGKSFIVSVSQERYYNISCLAIAAGGIYSLGSISLMGISLPLFCAIALTLTSCRRGALYGIVAGLLLGVCISPSYAPMLALCALAYVSISKLSSLGGAAAVCTAGLAFGLYAHGISALSMDLPALLSSSSVFFVSDKINVFDDIKRFFEKDTESSAELFEKAILSETRANVRDERLRAISDSFSSLSEIFYNLSSKLRRPTMLDLHSICEDSFDAVCRECPSRASCFGEEYASTLDVMKTMALRLHSHGTVDEKKLPEGFKKRCGAYEEIISSVNHSCAVATKRAFLNEKTEIFALDYDAISQILNDAILENENEFKIDHKLSKRLSRAISDEGFGEHRVTAFGKRKLRIIARGLDLSSSASDVSSLKKRLEEITHLSLSEPNFELSFGSVNMQIESKKAFSAELAFSISACAGESVCGDAVSIFENEDDYVYALISDGMGTGRAAALASETCNAFLRKMLSAGNGLESSLRMLNSVLRVRGGSSEDECSATIDLLRFDMYSGALTLIKSGASPTFVLRHGKVFKLASPSFPIGILRSPDAKQLELNCEEGDLIVMVSDGAVKNGDDLTYISDMLCERGTAELSAQAIADKIIRRSRAESDIPNDDVSAIVIKIKKDD